jgi:hypothetical protein
MELAELIVALMDALAWPTVILIVLFLFRSQAKAVFSRFSEGKEFELELGGQKLRINMLEKGIEQVASSVQAVDIEEDKETRNAIGRDLALLKKLSSMPALEIRLLAKFYATEKLSRAELKLKYTEAQINLHKSGFVEFGDDGASIYLTQMGHQALEWITGNK